MMRTHKLTMTVLATLGVLAGGFMFSAAPALATTGYGFTGSFGSEGSGNGQFKEPSGVAVNDATGDVYVVDKGNNRVEWFNSTGAKFEGQFNGSGTPAASFSDPGGIAVDNDASSPSKGDVYVEDVGNKVIDKFSAAGTYEGQLTGFGTLLGIAVDPSGDLWVLEAEETVYEYSDTGGLLEKFNTSLGTPDPGLAVDSNHDVYTNFVDFLVLTFEPITGNQLGRERGGGAGGLAIDAATNNLFVDRESGIVEYGPFGKPETTPVDVFGSKALADNGGSGIAVATAGTLYVADAVGDKVDIFSEGPRPEAPLTEAAKEVTSTTAVLDGELNPNAKKLAGWYFVYNLGTSCTGGQSTPVEAEAEVQAAKEHKEVSELEPSAQYTFCLVAENAFGLTFGLPETLTTLAAPPKVDSQSASGATSMSATLEAQVNPNNEKTSAYLQYSSSPAVIASGPEKGALTTATKESSGEVGSGYGDQPVAPDALTGLSVDSTYYYQAVATNATGTTYGTVQEFTTVPVPFTDAVTAIGTTTATLNGHVMLNPLNTTITTQFSFDYNLSATECVNGSSISAGEAGPGSGLVSVEKEVTGLEPNASYSVCLLSSNSFGSEVDPHSPPVHFTTLPAPPLYIGELAATVTAETPAVALIARVNPNNEQTSCSFQYGTEPALKTGTTTVPCGTGFGAGYGGQNASTQVEGLTAGETYYYRVVATNAAGTEYGAIDHFTAVVLPTVTTGAAQDPTRTSIAVAGTLDPNGVATSYHFAYIEEAGYQAALAQGARGAGGDLYADGATTASVEAGEGTSPLEVEVPVKGLLPETTYHYALVANSERGTVTGQDETFTTGAATPPIVTTGAASAITLSTATIAGMLSTQGLDVSYAFEVSTEPGNPGPPSGGGSIGAGPTEASVSVALQGLQPGTTYYYRLLATSTDGTSYGEIKTFTTPGFPSPLTQPATPPLIGTPNIAFPSGSEANTGTTTETKKLTNAQKLATALKTCHRDKSKGKRVACEKTARRRYGTVKKSKKKS
jgi:hypothetical protein